MRRVPVIAVCAMGLFAAAWEAHAQAQVRVATLRVAGMNVQLRLLPVRFEGGIACQPAQIVQIEQRARGYAERVAPKAVAEIRADPARFRRQGIDPRDPANFIRIDGGYGCSKQGSALLRFPAQGKAEEIHALRRGETAWRITRP